MHSSEFNIIRDNQYAKVFKRDMRRQYVRRIARKIGVLYELFVKKPGWEKKQTHPSRPTLSTCIITMNSENRIKPLLRYIRSFSDEIVVGVDSKTTDNTFNACSGLADQLFTIENNAKTCNGGLEELVRHCSGDWILRLDDDEFPEPDFEKVLTGLLQEPGATHYKLPRLHICSVEPLQWINDGYLYPDYQMRLFKNDKTLLTFPGSIGHLGISCAGPKKRINSVNLVHLNLAINPRFKREDKLKTYISRLNGGWVHPVNEQALLFEDFKLAIEPYPLAQSDFGSLLKEVTLTQRQAYEKAISTEQD